MLLSHRIGSIAHFRATYEKGPAACLPRIMGSCCFTLRVWKASYIRNKR